MLDSDAQGLCSTRKTGDDERYFHEVHEHISSLRCRNRNIDSDLHCAGPVCLPDIAKSRVFGTAFLSQYGMKSNRNTDHHLHQETPVYSMYNADYSGSIRWSDYRFNDQMDVKC